jgi:hypothetical protein
LLGFQVTSDGLFCVEKDNRAERILFEPPAIPLNVAAFEVLAAAAVAGRLADETGQRPTSTLTYIQGQAIAFRDSPSRTDIRDFLVGRTPRALGPTCPSCFLKAGGS